MGEVDAPYPEPGLGAASSGEVPGPYAAYDASVSGEDPPYPVSGPVPSGDVPGSYPPPFECPELPHPVGLPYPPLLFAGEEPGVKSISKQSSGCDTGAGLP